MIFPRLNTWRFSTFFPSPTSTFQLLAIRFRIWILSTPQPRPLCKQFPNNQLHHNNPILEVHWIRSIFPKRYLKQFHHYKAFSIECHPIWRTPPCSWLPFPSCHHLSSGPRAHCPLIRYARSAVATDDPGKTSLCPREGRVTLQKPKTNCTAPLQSTFAGKIKKIFGEEISCEELNRTIALYCKDVVGDLQCQKGSRTDPLSIISDKNIWEV